MTTSEIFVAGDFSGIQDYVLNVSAAGGGQARRLRARSFYVQAASEIAAWKIMERFGQSWDALVMGGGGQFLLRLPAVSESENKLAALQRELDQLLYSETRGELGLTLAWGRSREEALGRKEHQKRRLWNQTLVQDGWRVELMSMAALGRPCEVCGQQRAMTTRDDDGETVQVCQRCDADTEIGRDLPQAETVRLGAPDSLFSILGCGVTLGRRDGTSRSGVVVPRSVHRHVPVGDTGKLLTFEQIANGAKGDNLLGVLKADVDNMGMKVAEIANRDATLQGLSGFSAELDRFFSDQVQDELRKPKWRSIYTVYSGGDDLLLVGPWNVTLDFAGVVQSAFTDGPGKTYGLTLSAGVVLIPYRLPIRHAVERADNLLDEAKSGTKNQCAALGGVWDWKDHPAILGNAQQIVRWIESGACGRALIHRLLLIAERQDLKKAALWAYEVGRNFPRRDDPNPENRELREWGERVLAESLENDRAALNKIKVGLRYALIATRARRTLVT